MRAFCDQCVSADEGDDEMQGGACMVSLYPNGITGRPGSVAQLVIEMSWDGQRDESAL